MMVWDKSGNDMTQADERSRKSRWTARGRAEVSHPRYGTLTVPCGSPYEALLNACEVWGVDCVDVMREKKYTVTVARKGAKVTVAREYI